MRYSVLMLAVIFSLAGAAPALAGEPPVPIEGTMLVSGWDGDYGAEEPFAYFLEETSDNVTPAPLLFGEGDISPFADAVCYTSAIGDWPDYLMDVWVADIDGEDAANLTDPLGIGGINCIPQWSPDGSQIAFQHCDPEPGVLPCVTGFHVWVMDADGSNAHKVTAEGSPPTTMGSWSPNGYRLFLEMGGVGAVTIDQDGTDLEAVPNANGTDGRWSPDGSQLVFSRYVWDEVNGRHGVWRQIVLTDVHGESEEVLVEQFLADEDVADHVAAQGLDPAVYDWENDVRWWAGPVYPRWSPRGDRIAFPAALPFDPEGVHYKKQMEIWVYDLVSEDLTPITDNSAHENWLSWNGHNTFPYDPEVTVDNTTVTFDEVTEEGLTAIIRDDDPPDLPTGFQFCEEFYEVSTSAEYEGLIGICMTYRDEDIPTGSAEEDLAILHYVEDGEYWEDVTVSRDPDNNIVCGETESLSIFTLAAARPYRFPDVAATGYGPGGADAHWAFAEVEACAAADIVTGYGDGNYHPEWSISRGQMAVFIARALAGGEEGFADYEAPDTASFGDVPIGFWSFAHVEYCAEHGVVAGYADGLYRPNALVTRDQMAVYIARAIADPMGEEGLAGYEPPETSPFDDLDAEHWAYAHICYLTGESVVAGYPDGYYRPRLVVTRDQMAVYVARAFGLGM